LGIRIPSKIDDRELQSSQKITLSLKDHILDQDRGYRNDILNDQLQNKANISKDSKKKNQEEADEIYRQLPDKLQKAVDLAQAKGASTWLTVLPLTEHGFTLHKSAFHDALALWYHWTPSCLPSKCECGNRFNVEHALSSQRVVFHPSDNEIQLPAHRSMQCNVC